LILADTSVWVDHLRFGDEDMRQLLHRGQIVIHPFVVAELALESIKNRAKTLALLDLLPQARIAQLNELRLTIEARRLYSVGIGFTDAHLIASVLIDSPTLLWARDKKLRKVAENLGIHASLP
jgi:predicted nucleic acid-binding protein